MINSAYSRPSEGEGEQNLIKYAVRQNFGVPIHHYVEVNFESFKRAVTRSVGVGLVPTAVRDKAAASVSISRGARARCETALASARSRSPDHDAGRLGGDPRSDLSRAQRQQIFIHRALDKASCRSGPTRSGSPTP